jgi:SAM-dependent methyltransferase
MIGTINQKLYGSPLAGRSFRRASGAFPPESAIIERHAEEFARGRVLDIGIGGGRTTEFLAPRAGVYVGVDYAPRMVAWARERFPDRDIRFGDARDVAAAAPGPFDVVVFSYNGIDCVGPSDRLRVLASVRAALRPGGLFVFSAHNRACPARPAHDLANLRLGRHPVTFVRGIAVYLFGLWNAARNRRYVTETPEYALVNDMAEQYRSVHYYIRPADQVAQLRRAGFEDVTAYGVDGAPLDPELPSPDHFMVYYTARKPAARSATSSEERVAQTAGAS